MFHNSPILKKSIIIFIDNEHENWVLWCSYPLNIGRGGVTNENHSNFDKNDTVYRVIKSDSKNQFFIRK